MRLGLSFEFWVGTAIALAIAAVSAWVTLRRKRRTISISIVSSANLLSGVAKQIPNLSVHYQGKEIEKELVWVSGRISNTGDQDVGKSIVSQFPILQLDSSAKWREFSLAKLPRGMDAKSSIITPNEVQIAWDLLRPNEIIPFWAVIDTDDRLFSGRLVEGRGISVLARIENTDARFVQDRIKTDEEAADRARRGILMLLPILAITLVLGAMLIVSRPIFDALFNEPAIIAIELEGHKGQLYSENYRIEGSLVYFNKFGNRDRLLAPPQADLAVPVKDVKIVALHVMPHAKPDSFSAGTMIYAIISLLFFAYLAMTVLGIRGIKRDFDKYRALNREASWLRIVPFMKKK